MPQNGAPSAYAEDTRFSRDHNTYQAQVQKVCYILDKMNTLVNYAASFELPNKVKFLRALSET